MRSRKEDIKMKCPICGNDHFIKIIPPLLGSDGGTIRSNGCYGCTECGYTFFISKKAPEFYKEKQDYLKMIDDKIKYFDQMIEETKKNSSNIEYERKQLKSYKEELAFRQKKGEDNKTTRSLIESIGELEPIVKSGKRPDTERRVREFECQKEKCLKEKEYIQNSIEYLQE